VSLREGRLAAAEALVRWERPERGQLGPGEFLPFAEECGLIVPIGAWLREEACRQAERWRRDGNRRRPVTMHVNLSERQFIEPHLTDLVAGVLSATGTEPDQLCLEVSEGVLSANPSAAGTTLKRLAGLGVRVAVDDFGTGVSSVTSLDALPVSALKIDRSLVSRLDLDPDDDAVAAAVVGLAHTLDLLVIAEGVETRGSSPSSTSSAATSPRATCSPGRSRAGAPASCSARTAAGSSAGPGRVRLDSIRPAGSPGTDPSAPVYPCLTEQWRAVHWTRRKASSSNGREGETCVPMSPSCAGTRISRTGQPG
jgi:EAL domain-containing protein (putative c-di-GMP-specific phosphodiesterase class I)